MWRFHLEDSGFDLKDFPYLEGDALGRGCETDPFTPSAEDTARIDLKHSPNVTSLVPSSVRHTKTGQIPPDPKPDPPRCPDAVQGQSEEDYFGWRTIEIRRQMRVQNIHVQENASPRVNSNPFEILADDEEEEEGNSPTPAADMKPPPTTKEERSPKSARETDSFAPERDELAVGQTHVDSRIESSGSEGPPPPVASIPTFSTSPKETGSLPPVLDSDLIGPTPPSPSPLTPLDPLSQDSQIISQPFDLDDSSFSSCLSNNVTMTFPTPAKQDGSSTPAVSKLSQDSRSDSTNDLLTTKVFSQRKKRRNLDSDLARTITSPRSPGKTRSGQQFMRAEKKDNMDPPKPASPPKEASAPAKKSAVLEVETAERLVSKTERRKTNSPKKLKDFHTGEEIHPCSPNLTKESSQRSIWSYFSPAKKTTLPFNSKVPASASSPKSESGEEK